MAQCSDHALREAAAKATASLVPVLKVQKSVCEAHQRCDCHNGDSANRDELDGSVVAYRFHNEQDDGGCDSGQTYHAVKTSRFVVRPARVLRSLPRSGSCSVGVHGRSVARRIAIDLSQSVESGRCDEQRHAVGKDEHGLGMHRSCYRMGPAAVASVGSKASTSVNNRRSASVKAS